MSIPLRKNAITSVINRRANPSLFSPPLIHSLNGPTTNGSSIVMRIALLASGLLPSRTFRDSICRWCGISNISSTCFSMSGSYSSSKSARNSRCTNGLIYIHSIHRAAVMTISNVVGNLSIIYEQSIPLQYDKVQYVSYSHVAEKQAGIQGKDSRPHGIFYVEDPRYADPLFLKTKKMK